MGATGQGRNLYRSRAGCDAHPVEQLELLGKMDTLARSIDSRVQNVMASIAYEAKQVLIVRADGQIFRDFRPLLRLGVNVIVEDNGNRQTGRQGGEGHCLF